MDINTFQQTYSNYKDADKIQIKCDHPKHTPKDQIITIGKQPAKRNILKHDGKEFICRECCMTYNNPMNSKSENRQTDEIIPVFCPHPEHKGDPSREMKKKNYYGVMQQPYLQVCGSCAQLHKVISEEQKEKIRIALSGIKRSDEFKAKLSEYMKNNPEGIQRATKNLLENHYTQGMLGKKHSDETKQKMSDIHSGKIFTEEHCTNISIGRKKMLELQGGFSREHRENISKATIKQYRNGFEPKLHHLNGWHDSPKAGKIFYRSSYEKKAYIKLDEDPEVKTYYAEKINTEYFNPEKGINSSYLIDILVEFIDGSQLLIEVKPEKFLEDKIVSLKIEAGQKKADKLGIGFEVWTEMNLFGHVYNEKNMRSFIDKIRQGEI